jgi:hypothetical protein
MRLKILGSTRMANRDEKRNLGDFGSGGRGIGERR